MSGNIANGIVGASNIVGNAALPQDKIGVTNTPPVPIEKLWYDFTISEAENGFILYVRDKFGRQRSFIAENMNGAIDQVKAAFVTDKLET